MDHKISKDMISSGMIPSGEKTQADLGRTQYGSVPSPSSLMDAYRTIYEHHQKDADGKVIEHEEKEELNEGKMPEGLKNYLMKKNGKKEDKKDEMKKEGADLFDIVKNKLIDEGVDEKEALKIMVSLSEDELNEMLGGVKGDGYIGHPRLGIKNPLNPPKKEIKQTNGGKGLINKLGNRATEIERMLDEVMIMIVTNADKSGNTLAWQRYKEGFKSRITGKPLYKAALHLKDS